MDTYCHKGDCYDIMGEYQENTLNIHIKYIVMMIQEQIVVTLKCIQQMVVVKMWLFCIGNDSSKIYCRYNQWHGKFERNIGNVRI